MSYFVYLLKSITPGVNKTYAGYSSDVQKRLIKHNSNTGAKSTRGYKWKIIYSKRYKTKSNAMRNEYLLKKDLRKRNQIKSDFIKI